MGSRGSKQQQQQQVTESYEESPRPAFGQRYSRSFSGGRLARSFSSLDLTGKGKTVEQVEAFLSEIPLLRCLPRAKLRPLAEAAEKKKYTVGTTIIQKGDEGHSFFILQSGEAEVILKEKDDEEDDDVILLKRGDYFGERALLTMDVRAATVRAHTSVSALEITRDTFDGLGLREDLDFRGRSVIRVDGVQTVTLKPPAVQSRAEKKFLLDSLAGNPNISQFLNVHAMPELTNAAWKEEITAGETVIHQGDKEADYCYIIQTGEFAAIVDGKVVGHLGKGQCFGELSLLYSAPRLATVKATKNSLIWLLPRGWIKTAAQQSALTATTELLVYLNHVPALDILLQDEKQLLAPLLSECKLAQNDKIVGFTEEEASMYILTDGSARIVEDNDEVVEVTAGLSPGELQVYSFCEKALHGPGNASSRSVKITSPKATCYRLDGVDFVATFGPYLDVVAQVQRGFDFMGLEDDTEQQRAHGRENPSLLSLSKKDLRKVGPLRSGQFGNLELWQHTRTGEPYMIKAVSKGYVVEQGLQERIFQERDVMLMFDSPFTIQLLQTFTGNQTLYFLMETALGGDLYSVYLKNALHGSNRHALFYAAGILQALEHVHNRKVAYRDLKPENVFLAANGYVKLVNFGLAKVVSGRTYTILGTPEYLAPEIIGVSGHNQSVDWWAYGIFIFECLAGKTPFEDVNPMQTFGKTMAGIEKAVFPSKVSPAAERLIRALLKREPGRRLPMKGGGAANVRQADWYVGFDWRELKAQTMQPPFNPLLKSKTDTSNFNTEAAVQAPKAPNAIDKSGWDNAFPVFGIQSV